MAYLQVQVPMVAYISPERVNVLLVTYCKIGNKLIAFEGFVLLRVFSGANLSLVIFFLDNLLALRRALTYL